MAEDVEAWHMFAAIGSDPDATVRMLQVRRPAARPRPSARRGDGPRTVRRAQCQRALT